MIEDLEVVLRRVLLGAFTGSPPSEGWIRFQPPDDTWRQ
jgi:hypothetical protein